ncbi:MAG: PAS domain S-box protein [Acidobacteriota bacterium]|nr:PAS domain S-box protein [Acidobacteriota bacterium]
MNAVDQSKQFEMELIENRARHDAILQASLDGIITIDHEGRILEFNSAAEAIFGYRQADVIGQEMASLIIPPHLRELHRKGLARYLETRRATVLGKRIELTGMRFDGSEFPAELAIAAVERSQRPVFIAFLRDISGRKKTEQELISLSRLTARVGTLLAGRVELQAMLGLCAQLLVDELGAAFARIWLLNESETILELSASAGQYTHTDGSHGRIPVGKLKIGLIAQERKPHLTNAVEGDPRIGDQDWVRREKMVAFAGYPLIAENRLEGVMGLFSRSALSDSAHLSLSSISDGIALAIQRTRHERDLRASEERTRQVLESITDAFFAVDDKWEFTYTNHRAEQLLARAPGSLIHKNLWREFPESIGTSFEENYRNAVATGRKVSFQAYFEPLKLWTEVHAYPSGPGLSVYFQDISGRLHMEEKLRQTAKLEGLGVMAGGIAHDFNNLLTGILGNASLLTEIVPPEYLPAVEDIVKASERAADLTHQMLAFAGKGRFQVKKLDLSNEVREILRIIKASIHKDAGVVVHLADKLPCIEGDPGQIQQLVMNLVINASDAMEGIPGTITIETKEQEVDEAYIAQTFGTGQLTPGWYVSLEVHDTGCGMSEETRAKIFDPFFTTKFAGRGLGLAAALGIVRGHKGALKVYSAVGRGSTFKVILPAVAGETQKSTPAASEPRWRASGTILVIDDQEIVRRVAKTTLESTGCKVLVANDGATGIELLKQFANEVSLVLLDLTMPRMDGEETMSHLRLIRPGIRVIVSSGYNEVEIIRRFTSQRFAGFIQKPYSAPGLLAKVREVMESPAV